MRATTSHLSRPFRSLITRSVATVNTALNVIAPQQIKQRNNQTLTAIDKISASLVGSAAITTSSGHVNTAAEIDKHSANVSSSSVTRHRLSQRRAQTALFKRESSPAGSLVHTGTRTECISVWQQSYNELWEDGTGVSDADESVIDHDIAVPNITSGYAATTTASSLSASPSMSTPSQYYLQPIDINTSSFDSEIAGDDTAHSNTNDNSQHRGRAIALTTLGLLAFNSIDDVNCESAEQTQSNTHESCSTTSSVRPNQAAQVHSHHTKARSASIRPRPAVNKTATAPTTYSDAHHPQLARERIDANDMNAKRHSYTTSLDDMTAEEIVIMNSFAAKVDTFGRLLLKRADLTCALSWNVLGKYLAAAPHIVSLRFEGMSISQNEATQLGAGALKAIRNITFIDNRIGLNEGTLEVIIAILLLCEYLESASIQRNCLSDRHTSPIDRLIRQHPALACLSLCWNGITANGATQLAHALRALTQSRSKLQSLDVSHNRLTSKGVDDLTRAKTSLARHGRHIDVRVKYNTPKTVLSLAALRSPSRQPLHSMLHKYIARSQWSPLPPAATLPPSPPLFPAWSVGKVIQSPLLNALRLSAHIDTRALTAPIGNEAALYPH